MKILKKVCKICGIEFETIYNHQKICSKKCRMKDNSTKLRKYRRTKKSKEAYKKYENSDKRRKGRLIHSKNRSEYIWNLKSIIIKKLGNKCKSCGIGDIRVLSIHHLNGGGNKERKMFGGDYIKYYNFILNDLINSEKYKLLCKNCHAIEHIKFKDVVPKD